MYVRAFQPDPVRLESLTYGEELVAEHPLATAAAGTAQEKLKLAKGGEYVSMRREATASAIPSPAN